MIELLKSWKEAAPAAAAAIGAISALVALIVLLYTRKANRRRATLDMVLKTFIDDAGRARYDQFKRLIERHKSQTDEFDIKTLANPDTPTSIEKSILRDQINEYELIALGIRKGVFEETIYKLWFQAQYIRDFENMKPYIDTVRKKRPSVFCEYKWLYERWKKVPHPENTPKWWKRLWWGLTNNKEKLRAYLDSNP